MAGSSTSQTFSGGRLILNPTTLGSPQTDCGGTQAGTVHECRVVTTRRQDAITMEGYGSSLMDAIVLDEEIAITIVCTGWDDELMSQAYFGGNTSVSGVPLLQFPPTAAVGGLAGDSRAPSLLWLPNHETRDPCWIAYKPMAWSFPKKYRFSARHPLVTQITFLCARRSDNLVFRTGLLSDIAAL